jgi:serine/threonine protein phosphatase PrpC
MSDSSQPPFTEQPKGDGVLMGRLWSVASLGVNEPNEDHWQVESDRLFHDYASVDLDARLSRMLHTDAQVDYPEAGIVWGLQEPKSGSKKITETASDQMERLQDRSDTWCDSDSDDSFTVCILDGHEGSTCCELLQNLLLKSIRERCSSNGRHTELLRAIGPSGFCERLAETFEHVDRQLLEHLWQKLEETGDGHYAITGACCVTATLTNGGNDLFVASLGDCEAYLGRRGLVSDEDSPDKESSVTSSSRQRMEAMQLCYSHNLRIESNMKCLQDQFPGDPSVVQKIGNNYFVKGKLQVSHAFGNGYLKEERFNEKLYPIFRAKPPFCGRYVSSKPQVRHISLTERDEFLILATDGFWEHVDPRSAVALIGHFFAPDSAQIDKKDADTIDPRRACELLMQYLWLRLHCSESIEADSADEVLQRKQRGKRGGRLRDDTSVLVLFLHPTELPNRDAANSYTGSLDYVDWCEKQDDDSASRARILRGMVSAWLNASE